MCTRAGKAGTVKSQIFGYNAARLYNLDLRADYGALHPDKFDEIKQTYQLAGGLVPNASCGYIKKTA
jgi:hypothetical protein